MTDLRLVIAGLIGIGLAAVAGIIVLAALGAPTPSVLEVVAGGAVTGLAAVLARGTPRVGSGDEPGDRSSHSGT